MGGVGEGGLCAAGHWVLLQADREMRTLKFSDSLSGPVSDIVLEICVHALMFWKLMPSWSWVPLVVPARWNAVRQGPLECGFFVATWLERAILEAAGKPSVPMSEEVDVKQLKTRLLKMLEAWGPTMKRMQKEVRAGELLVLEGEERPAGGTAQADLEEDLFRAAAGFRTGEEPTGAAAEIHPLEKYANEDEWASAVLEHLSEEHQALCTEVHLKEADEVPCSKCTGGCRHCVFWRAVRYWRNVETGGRATEGYDKRSCSLARLKGNVGSQVELN